MMAAPILDSLFSPTLCSVLEGATNPIGITVAELVVDGSITNPDGAAVEAIVVEAVNTSLGTWQYSLDGNPTWLTIRADLINSETNTLGLLLGPTDKIRLLPFGDLNGTLNDAITFRAWDQSSGTAGDYVVTTPGSGAFSAESDTASISVVPVNDAPTFSPVAGGGKAIVPGGDWRSMVLVPIASLSLQSDGKLILAGSSSKELNSDFSVIRLNVDGSLDCSFDLDGIAIVPATIGDNYGLSSTLQADGKILVAGFSYSSSSTDFSVVRLNDNGSLDASFGSNGKVVVHTGYIAIGWSVTVQANGGILIAGFSNNGLNSDFCIVRLNDNGSLDAGFGSSGKVFIPVGTDQDGGFSVTTQADSKILIAGFSNSGLNYGFSIVRLNDNGSLDSSFGDGGKVIIPVISGDEYGQSVTVQADGRILVAGSSYNGSNYDFSVVRLNQNGTLDTGFGAGGTVIIPVTSGEDYGRSVTVQTDGKILIGGRSSVGSITDFSLVRLNSDGSLDGGFSSGGKSIISVGSGSGLGSSVSIQTDGQILIAGYSFVDSSCDFSVIRLNRDGSLDSTFNGIATNTLVWMPSDLQGKLRNSEQ